eukprot:scaffold21794_cov47-Cyclotella_meneghiniana.AAC.7
MAELKLVSCRNGGRPKMIFWPPSGKIFRSSSLSPIDENFLDSKAYMSSRGKSGKPSTVDCYKVYPPNRGSVPHPCVG